MIKLSPKYFYNLPVIDVETGGDISYLLESVFNYYPFDLDGIAQTLVVIKKHKTDFSNIATYSLWYREEPIALAFVYPLSDDFDPDYEQEIFITSEEGYRGMASYLQSFIRVEGVVDKDKEFIEEIGPYILILKEDSEL